MSIDLNWETLTSGPDGAELAERIRVFIHDKFQTVPLPRFIRSVEVHGFDFGNIAPELELKDITDPFPDFYDPDVGEGESDDDFDSDEDAETAAEAAESRAKHAFSSSPSADKRRPRPLRTALQNDGYMNDLTSPFLGTATPGILGGSGGFHYFQSHLGTGTQTPLAAVAGAHWMGPPLEQSTADLDHIPVPSHSRNPSQSSISVSSYSAKADGSPGLAPLTSLDGVPIPQLREKSSVSTLAPTAVGSSRPPTRDMHGPESAAGMDEEMDAAAAMAAAAQEAQRHRHEPRVDDMQAVFRIRYAGDIRLNLTAEILLDYPMPSFVGIPLKLNITGLSFDGVGVLAKIRKRVHFCFLSPDDAMAAVGGDEPKQDETDAEARKSTARFGGLLQEVKVESEIGEQESGKQSLKNVGKVERFVLDQVRRIFDEEFVYPSYWTFLV